MTDLLAATGSFMTLLFFVCERVKKLLYAYKSFDSWWRAESTSMSVYAVRLVCDASHVNVGLISGLTSDHVHRFVCQVHIWGGEPMAFRFTHNVWKVQESRCTRDEKKKTFSWSLFLSPCPPVYSACFHRSVNVIWAWEWYFILTV